MILILLLVLLLPTWADSLEDRLRAYVSKHWSDAGQVRIDGAWAVVELQGDEPAQLLFHQDEGWRLIDVQSRGITIPAEEMCRVGVPRAAIPKLLGKKVEASEFSNGPFTPVFSERPLASLDGYSRDSWSLMLARNEIYARHGRPFQDPVLRAYFAALPWYKPRAGYKDSDLTALERANVKALQELEKQQRAKEAVVK